MHVIHIEGDAEIEFRCREDESILKAQERAGIRAVKVGCRSGGCGVCRVQVTAGQFVLGATSRAYVDEEEQEQGFALACRLYPRGNLSLRPVPKIRAQVPAAPPPPHTTLNP